MSNGRPIAATRCSYPLHFNARFTGRVSRHPGRARHSLRFPLFEVEGWPIASASIRQTVWPRRPAPASGRSRACRHRSVSLTAGQQARRRFGSKGGGPAQRLMVKCPGWRARRWLPLRRHVRPRWAAVVWVISGPSCWGSTVNISPLDGSLNPTGQVFSTQTADDLGQFSVQFMASGRVALEGNGFYYNGEVTGVLSNAQLTLRAIYDVQADGPQKAYINLVTQFKLSAGEGADQRRAGYRGRHPPGRGRAAHRPGAGGHLCPRSASAAPS